MSNNPVIIVNTPPIKRQNKTIKVSPNSKYDNNSIQSFKKMILNKNPLFIKKNLNI